MSIVVRGVFRVTEEMIWARRHIVRVVQFPYGFLSGEQFEEQYEERYVFEAAGQMVKIEHVDAALVHGVHHGYEDQRQEGGEDQAEHHRPGERAPEGYVVAAE